MEPRPESGESSQPSVASGYLRYSSLGVQFALFGVGFGLLGHWLDGKLCSEPWGLLGGLLFGFFGGFVWLYRRVYPAGDQVSAPPESPTSRQGGSDAA